MRRKILVTPDLMEKFTAINKALVRCCELALKQPLPNKQLAQTTDTSFSAAGYAVLIEEIYINEESICPSSLWIQTFSPTQLKMSIYAKDCLAIFFAFKEFGLILGNPETGDYTYRQQVRHTIFSDENHSLDTLECT